MRKLIHPIWKFRHLLFALTALWAVQAISQEPTPNLSGIWRWNPDKSHVSGRPATNRRVKIEQQGSDLTITTRVMGEAGENIQKFHYTIGSDDNTNQMMGAPLKSKVQWKDGALAVDSVATLDMGEVRRSETWTLSADGQTLTLHASSAMGDRPPARIRSSMRSSPRAIGSRRSRPSPRKRFTKTSRSSRACLLPIS